MSSSLLLGKLLTSSAIKFPEKIAVTFGEQRFTYRTLEERANRVANALLALGLKKGDRCAILFYNRAEWLEVYFGLARTGIIAVPVNFRFAASEVEYILNNSEPKALIYEDSFLPIVEFIKGRVSSLRHFICLGKSEDPSYDQWVAKASTREPTCLVEETDPFFIAYTSGTTGFPKGAVITHRNLIIHYSLVPAQYGNINQTDRMLLIMPIFHSNSTWFAQILVMMGGSLIVYRSGSFDPEEILRFISEERITLISFVPTMLTMILNLPESVKQKYDVSSMKAVLAGSAPLMTRTKEQTIEYFKNPVLFEGYGSTETGMVTVLRPEDQLRKVRSVGLAAVGKEIRLLDEEGNDVPRGSVGELYARGLGILLVEYWKDPQATAKAFRGDWCTVGDMGRIDEEGFYYLEDRKADMIISGGENIYPTEVENVLVKHPSVLESAVVAVPDPLWGEKVHAVIVLKEGRKAAAEELIDFCRDKLAGYKRPRSIDFIEELPKSSTGKILRRKVREVYWGEGKKLYI